jgi:hypothetical protein
MDHYKDVDVKIGDHVRRRGLLAEMFGDEEGTVVEVRHKDESYAFEVQIGGRHVVYTAQQLIVC